MKTDESEPIDNEVEESTEPGADALKGKGVKVPEQFQQSCHELLSKCDSLDCCDYLSTQVSAKRSELSKGSDSEFSSAEMPSN